MSLLDSLKPKWKHSDPEQRIAAVKDLDDAEILEKLLFSDPVFRVRLAVLEKIRDTAILTRVAREDDNSKVRLAAVARIRDPRVLAELAASHPDVQVRIGAVDLFPDEAALVRVAVENDSEHVRMAAVKRISDARALLDVAAKSVAMSTRLAAVKRIEDPAVLSVVIERSKNVPLRMAAVEKLADIPAKADPSRPKVLAAPFAEFTDLSDPKLLNQAFAALARVGDPAALYAVIKSKAHVLLRWEALTRVRAPALFESTAAHDPDPRMRQAAVMMLDPEALPRAGLKDANYRVRMAAVARLADPDLVRRVCETDPDYRVRLGALSRINDAETLEGIAKGNSARAVRAAAECKIGRRPFMALLDKIYLTPFLGKLPTLVRAKPPTEFRLPEIQKAYATAVQAAVAAIDAYDEAHGILGTENPSILYKTAQSAKSHLARLLAVEKIAQPSFLFSLLTALSGAVKIAEDYVRWAVLERLGEKDLLAFSGFDWEHVKAMNDEGLLCTVMASEEFPNLAVIAEERYRSILTRGTKFHNKFGDTMVIEGK